jgi:hypothetical protein
LVLVERVVQGQPTQVVLKVAIQYLALPPQLLLQSVVAMAAGKLL